MDWEEEEEAEEVEEEEEEDVEATDELEEDAAEAGCGSAGHGEGAKLVCVDTVCVDGVHKALAPSPWLSFKHKLEEEQGCGDVVVDEYADKPDIVTSNCALLDETEGLLLPQLLLQVDAPDGGKQEAESSSSQWQTFARTGECPSLSVSNRFRKL